jgi:hypothetical protein
MTLLLFICTFLRVSSLPDAAQANQVDTARRATDPKSVPGTIDGLIRVLAGVGMADITMLILDDHDWFREQFARLDYLQAQTPVDRGALTRVWRPLADKLDVHAYIEEKLFYPQLLKRGAADPEGETLDAIGDHNDIRDGVRDANAARVGTDEWWAAVGRTRLANDDHMSEEERDGLADFRRHAPVGLREALGRQYSEFMAAHPTTRGLPIVDRDPEQYVESVENPPRSKADDYSLRIGSLKGK